MQTIDVAQLCISRSGCRERSIGITDSVYLCAQKLNIVLGLMVNRNTNLGRNIILTPKPYQLIRLIVEIIQSWVRSVSFVAVPNCMVIQVGLLMPDPVAEMRGDFADGKC